MRTVGIDDQTCSMSEDVPATQKCFSPNTALFRYVGLVFTCLVGFGSFFCMDNPGSLQDKFKNDMNMSASNFVLLYSVYSWPNVILCFVGGFLLDKVFGVRWGTIIYATLALCGQLLFAIGTYINVFWLMVLGRFIFGIGAESTNIAQKNYAVLWFKGGALNALFGLQLSIAKLGSAANSLSLEKIHRGVSENTNYTGFQRIGIVLFISATTCLGSLICALLLGYMDKKVEKCSKREKIEKSESVKLIDIKDFQLVFWMVVLIISSYYIAIFPFISLAKLYFMTKFEFDPDQANTAVSLVYGTSVIFSPIFGILIDKTGRNILWVTISIMCSLFSHGLLAFTYLTPYVCTVFLGISYAMLASSLWPMIALVVPEHQLGTAYGISQAVQNLNLAIMSIVSGIIVDHYGYFMLELFFLGWIFSKYGQYINQVSECVYYNSHLTCTLVSLVPTIVIWLSNKKSIYNN